MAEEAVRDAAEGLIVVVDRDGDERKQAWLDEGSEAATTDLPIVARVAVETLEAWLMGDAGAFARLGLDTPPPRPEELPGGSSSSKHPKSVLRALLQSMPGSNTARYEALATNLDLGVVAVTCPESFEPFRAALRQAFPGRDSRDSRGRR